MGAEVPAVAAANLDLAGLIGQHIMVLDMTSAYRRSLMPGLTRVPMGYC